MKSKTHHKKCVELGISPIPTTVPDDYNGNAEEAGMAGPSDGSNGPQGKPVAGDSDSDDEDMDTSEEDDEQFEDAEGDDPHPEPPRLGPDSPGLAVGMEEVLQA